MHVNFQEVARHRSGPLVVLETCLPRINAWDGKTINRLSC
jgi:hypothetical protein